MQDLQHLISQYLRDCQYQKSLDPKTIKAYRIDLAQFSAFIDQNGLKLTREGLMEHITQLHQQYKRKSVLQLSGIRRAGERKSVLPASPEAESAAYPAKNASSVRDRGYFGKCLPGEKGDKDQGASQYRCAGHRGAGTAVCNRGAGI